MRCKLGFKARALLMEAENAHKHTESLTLHRHADFTAQYWKAAKMKEKNTPRFESSSRKTQRNARSL